MYDLFCASVINFHIPIPGKCEFVQRYNGNQDKNEQAQWLRYKAGERTFVNIPKYNSDQAINETCEIPGDNTF